VAERRSGDAVAIRVQPRGSRNEVVGERAGAIAVRVTAPPAEGRANAAVIELVASVAGVPRRKVELVRGERSREKLVRVVGMSAEQLRAALLAASNTRPGRG